MYAIVLASQLFRLALQRARENKKKIFILLANFDLLLFLAMVQPNIHAYASMCNINTICILYMSYCVEISLFYNASINGNLFLSLFFECVCVCVRVQCFCTSSIYLPFIWFVQQKYIEKKKTDEVLCERSRAKPFISRLHIFYIFKVIRYRQDVYVAYMCYCVLYWFSICYFIIIIGWTKFKVKIYLKTSCLFKDCYFFLKLNFELKIIHLNFNALYLCFSFY